MTPNDLKAIAFDMEQLVQAAATALRTNFKAFPCTEKNEKAEKNGLPDFGVALEQKIEKYIKESLQNSYPDIGFVGEENGGQAGDIYFLLDPLDGTKNFVYGRPEYAISLALIKDGKPIIAILSAPEENIVITAIKGQGCIYKGGKIAAPTYSARHILLDAEINFMDNQSVSLLQSFAHAVSGVRKAGSTVWAVTMMLTGQRCQAVIADHLETHDITGCLLALEEAGYTVSDGNRKRPTINSKTLVAFPRNETFKLL